MSPNLGLKTALKAVLALRKLWLHLCVRVARYLSRDQWLIGRLI